MPAQIGHIYVASFVEGFHNTSSIDHGVRVTQYNGDDLTPDEAEWLAAHLLWRAALVRYMAGEPGARKPRARFTGRGDAVAVTRKGAAEAVPLTKVARPS